MSNRVKARIAQVVGGLIVTALLALESYGLSFSRTDWDWVQWARHWLVISLIVGALVLAAVLFVKSLEWLDKK